MTVSLLIDKKGTDYSVAATSEPDVRTSSGFYHPSVGLLVPIATTATFEKWWEPGIKAIGAKWMETFSYGWNIDFEHLPEVIIELRKFRRWLESIDDVEMMEFLCDRVDRLIDTLNVYVENNCVDYEYNFG